MIVEERFWPRVACPAPEEGIVRDGWAPSTRGCRALAASDALVVVVSEETGAISVIEGKITRNLTVMAAEARQPRARGNGFFK